MGESNLEPGEFWNATAAVLEENGEAELAALGRELGDRLGETATPAAALADGAIDLGAPLDDGREVFEPAIEGVASWRLETPHFLTTELEDPPATLQIEEIANGDVWLHTDTEEAGLELATLVQLPPDGARQLGRILIRAAAYADAQGGVADGED